MTDVLHRRYPAAALLVSTPFDNALQARMLGRKAASRYFQGDYRGWDEGMLHSTRVRPAQYQAGECSSTIDPNRVGQRQSLQQAHQTL